MWIAIAISIYVARYISGLPDFSADYVGHYVGNALRVEGIVVDEKGEVEVLGFEYLGAFLPLKGNIELVIFGDYIPALGDRVSVFGLLSEPMRKSPYVGAVIAKPEIRLIRSGEWPTPLLWLGELKKIFVERLSFVLPEPSASLAAGILLGSREAIPKNILQDFQRTGLTHILAISGFNIIIMVGFLMYVFSIFHRRIAVWFSILIVVIFTLLVGAGASVVRASIMGSLGLFAQLLGRKSSGLRALFLAGGIMLLIDPFLLFYDIGFELSFAATAGILIFGERIKNYLNKIPNMLGIRDSLATTLSAQIFTTPIIIYYFRIFSVIAPVSNFIVLPAIPFLMLGSFLCLIFGQTIVGQIIACPVFLLFNAVIAIVHFLASLPFSFIEVGIS